LDILYLGDLSDDAIPEMVRVLDPSSPDYQKYTDEFREEVKRVFNNRANRYYPSEYRHLSDWQSWNYSNQLATRIVFERL
jgi:hypothetical protein